MVHILDITMFVISLSSNISLTVLFLGRGLNKERAEYFLGLLIIFFGFACAFLSTANLIRGRELALILLPLPFFVFAIFEMILDYIMKIEFRKTRILYPYLVIFYLGLFGLIGYNFIVDKTFGALVLISYFIQLAASMYAVKKVGH